MLNPADIALEKLKTIITEFSALLKNNTKLSETDTRIKIIDRILKEVCLWPEEAITREDHVDSGFTDYQLKIRDRPHITVEAKRVGASFVLPNTNNKYSLSLNGSILTDPDVKEAIYQVRRYCDDEGIKFAVVTNGITWIVFRAIRDDMPWRKGRALIFDSLEYILKHFVRFWNLLSYSNICNGSLETSFSSLPPLNRSFRRVLDELYNADLPIQRNRLHQQLQPLIKNIFEDIAVQHNIDLFKSCYVHTNSLEIVSANLNIAIEDKVPDGNIFLDTMQIVQTENNAGVFNVQVEKAIRLRQGELYLLLGGVGSGKTTFLKRYEMVIAQDFLTKHAFVFHVDFLKAPLALDEIENFVWLTILNVFRHKYGELQLESRKHLKQIFKDRLDNLSETSLRKVKKHTDDYEEKISDFLAEWQQKLSEYVPRLLKRSGLIHNRAAVLFIDNVDQLNPDYQASIFLLSQRITRLADSVTVIALREESYYTTSIQKTFSAYTSNKFHIASPPFRTMIENRIEYAITALDSSDKNKSFLKYYGHTLNKTDICEFLRIVQSSVLRWNQYISRFMGCICFGNMRRALEMFTTFLTSGATDVDKMLNIYRREQRYHVAFHEFLKSVMLQDRAYYKESQSPILNLFNCLGESNSSHFTTLRILRFLLEHRGKTTPEGQGYIEVSRLVGFFANIFDNVSDVAATLDRLVNRQLIEVNTRSLSSVEGASHVRITASGWYYSCFLSHTFAYLDLVLQDTPISDGVVVDDLRKSVYDVNNLSDSVHLKADRMQTRFDRTQVFLNYLQTEEDNEFERYELLRQQYPINIKIMPLILEKFAKSRAYIEHKLEAGRDDELPEEADSQLGRQFEDAFIKIEDKLSST